MSVIYEAGSGKVKNCRTTCGSINVRKVNGKIEKAPNGAFSYNSI